MNRLLSEGLISTESGKARTTRRFQGAMARAAARLYGLDQGEEDLRVPLSLALLDVCGDKLSDQELAALVEVMLPIEVAELDPRQHLNAPNAAPR